MELTGDDVQDILRLLDTLPFGELHLETARFTLSLRRAPDGGWTQEWQVPGEPDTLLDAGARDAGVRDAGVRNAGPSGAAATPGPHGGLEDGLAEVRSPLLGTFYRAPRPGAPPFVDVGSTVGEHTVVGIVETMKLMNSVAAGISGTVAEIVVGNAQFAEQGAVLMRIRQHP